MVMQQPAKLYNSKELRGFESRTLRHTAAFEAKRKQVCVPDVQLKLAELRQRKQKQLTYLGSWRNG